MLSIEITVRGAGPRNKVGALVAQVLRDQLGASAWTVNGDTRDAANRIEETFRYTNEGRKR